MKRLFPVVYGRRERYNSEKVFAYYRDIDCTQFICRDHNKYYLKDRIVIINGFKYSLKVLKSNYA